MTLKISRSQVFTQPNPTHQKFKKNSDPTQPMDGPNPWPTLGPDLAGGRPEAKLACGSLGGRLLKLYGLTYKTSIVLHLLQWIDKHYTQTKGV